MTAAERSNIFRCKVIDILSKRFPDTSVALIRQVAAELTELHMEQDNELLEFIIDNMFPKAVK